MTKKGNPRWTAFRVGVAIGAIFMLGLLFILVFSRVLEFAFAFLRSCLASIDVL